MARWWNWDGKTLIVFDCDGVLLDTNGAKVDVFKGVLDSLLTEQKHVVQGCEVFKQLFGKTRPVIFSGIFDLFEQLEYPNPQTLVEQMLSEYSKGVGSLYRSANLIDENISFLKKVASTRSVCVVSASEQQQLQDLLPTKISDIDPTLIFGGPCKKDEHLKTLTQKFGHLELFVGDSVSDAQVALALKIRFFAVTKYSLHPHELKNFCSENALPFANTLQHFPLDGFYS